MRPRHVELRGQRLQGPPQRREEHAVDDVGAEGVDLGRAGAEVEHEDEGVLLAEEVDEGVGAEGVAVVVGDVPVPGGGGQGLLRDDADDVELDVGVGLGVVRGAEVGVLGQGAGVLAQAELAAGEEGEVPKTCKNILVAFALLSCYLVHMMNTFLSGVISLTHIK